MGLSTDRATGLREEGQGLRGKANRRWKALKTSFECFAILAAVLTAHAQALISSGLCSD